jgi:hypothetical protein
MGRTKSYQIWQCDLCNAEESVNTSSTAQMPLGWRSFNLIEEFSKEPNKLLGTFSVCNKCCEPYKTMPPIRRALKIFVWNKDTSK